MELLKEIRADLLCATSMLVDMRTMDATPATYSEYARKIERKLEGLIKRITEEVEDD